MITPVVAVPDDGTIRSKVHRLSNVLLSQRPAYRENLAYYNATHRLRAIGLAAPPEMRHLVAASGIPRLYLDSIEERLDLEGFRIAESPGTDARLWSWWQHNQLDEQSSLAHLEAMIHGAAYVTVSAPDETAGDVPEVPVIRVESPLYMTAEIDPRTRKVTQALRLYRSLDSPEEDMATLYLPDRTLYLRKGGGSRSEWVVDDEVVHNLGVVPVVPLVNRERLSDLCGQSEILPEIRAISDAASRIMMNLQAAAELMAVPQRLLFGVSAEEFANHPDSPGATLEAYLARILAFESPDGKALQFSAADLRNFTDTLQELFKQAAAYTGLPPQYLSFSSENPASAEAIRAAEARLVKKAERKARMFGGAWEEVMRLAVKIIDGTLPPELYRLEAIWRDPATPTYAAKADAAAKLYANGMGPIPRRRVWLDMGYTAEEIRQLEDWVREEEAATRALSALVSPRPELTSERGAE